MKGIKKEKFLWRDRAGVMHDPKDMESSYLLNVCVMIWNHSVPLDSLTIGSNPQRYVFPSFYTKQYMLKAFKICLKELKKRNEPGISDQIIKLMREDMVFLNSEGYNKYTPDRFQEPEEEGLDINWVDPLDLI